MGRAEQLKWHSYIQQQMPTALINSSICRNLKEAWKCITFIIFAGSGLEPGSRYGHEGTTLLSHQQLRGRLVGEVTEKITNWSWQLNLIPGKPQPNFWGACSAEYGPARTHRPQHCIQGWKYIIWKITVLRFFSHFNSGGSTRKLNPNFWGNFHEKNQIELLQNTCVW